MIVSCLRIMSWLTSMVTLPPSPTKQTVPQVRVALIAAVRAALTPEQSSAGSTPAPCVSVRFNGDSPDTGFRTQTLRHSSAGG
jgi:hypothetical protein